jgi:hypothetical protein
MHEDAALLLYFHHVHSVQAEELISSTPWHRSLLSPSLSLSRLLQDAVSGNKAKDYSQGELSGALKDLGYTSAQVFKF